MNDSYQKQTFQDILCYTTKLAKELTTDLEVIEKVTMSLVYSDFISADEKIKSYTVACKELPELKGKQTKAGLLERVILGFKIRKREKIINRFENEKPSILRKYVCTKEQLKNYLAAKTQNSKSSDGLPVKCNVDILSRHRRFEGAN